MYPSAGKQSPPVRRIGSHVVDVAAALRTGCRERREMRLPPCGALVMAAPTCTTPAQPLHNPCTTPAHDPGCFITSAYEQLPPTNAAPSAFECAKEASTLAHSNAFGAAFVRGWAPLRRCHFGNWMLLGTPPLGILGCVCAPWVAVAVCPAPSFGPGDPGVVSRAFDGVWRLENDILRCWNDVFYVDWTRP